MTRSGARVATVWGSDPVAHLLQELDLKYAALVPGASFRGLHDSLVNYTEGDDPRMLVCLHEEHAVAIAHGYAKVTGKPMLAVLHANVGLMHATMAIFGAWCDRVPMIIIGANGPRDASKRRPWIDWIHTSQDAGALVRHYTKWDDEPGSVEATMESILHAYQVATTAPFGPTMVILDAALQEARVHEAVAIPPIGRYAAPAPAEPAAEDVQRACAIMRNARRPVLLVGRMSREVDAWNDRVALAEVLGARVVTDLKCGAVFPSNHPLHVGMAAAFLTAEGIDAVRDADAILSLEMIDLAGTLQVALGSAQPTASIVCCSIDRYVHNGWSKDHQPLAPADLTISVTADKLVAAMLNELRAADAGTAPLRVVSAKAPGDFASSSGDGVMDLEGLFHSLTAAFEGREVCYIRLPLGAVGGLPFTFTHPLDCLGGDGAGGIGAGPGLSVGAALALKGSGRLPVAVLGDGDYLMGLTALWTAVSNDIPLLVVVANNHCYYNDVAHQERVALTRERPVERKWIGQMLADPVPDLAMLARGQGAIGLGRVESDRDLAAALALGISHVEAGRVCVVDCYVSP